ncbi:MAG: hypothetical protein CXR30_15075 [Geobacter sp.]|nr:MAG: hypothetical protein CXR30_15075 [Geobacter sp.]
MVHQSVAFLDHGYIPQGKGSEPARYHAVVGDIHALSVGVAAMASDTAAPPGIMGWVTLQAELPLLPSQGGRAKQK